MYHNEEGHVEFEIELFKKWTEREMQNIERFILVKSSLNKTLWNPFTNFIYFIKFINLLVGMTLLTDGIKVGIFKKSRKSYIWNNFTSLHVHCPHSAPIVIFLQSPSLQLHIKNIGRQFIHKGQ